MDILVGLFLEYPAASRQFSLHCGQTFEGPIFLSMLASISAYAQSRAAQTGNPVEPRQLWVTITQA
ncbi:hypothetical protein X801_04165, partial [Opisthorchis viverrini]